MANKSNNKPVVVADSGKQIGRINVSMSPMEHRMWINQSTPAHQRMLKHYEAQVNEEKVALEQMKSERADLESYITGNVWKQHAQTNEDLKMIDGVISVVQSDEGIVQSIKPLSNDYKLNPIQQQQLMGIDKIGFKLHQDGLFEQQIDNRKLYEAKDKLEKMPYAYTDAYVNRPVMDGKLVEDTAQMQTIRSQFSEGGRRVALDMKGQLDTNIHNAEVKLGLRNAPIQEAAPKVFN